MAGRVYRQDPLTGERVAAGYQNVASAMEQEREQVDAALLLDSGDAVDNSLLQDGGEAEALALRAIGYDVLVPGLNEFRLGPDARDGFFDALTAEEEETAPVRVLSGNYLDGDSQEPAAEGYAVLTAEVGGRAVRVGVLGLGAIDGAERLPASYCEGVDFAHGDNTENSYVWEWTEYWQEKLEGENCDLVVVVCHAGQDELARFAAETTGIDLPGEAGTIMHKKEDMGNVELATVAFGQSFQITAIQLLTTASSIINGGNRITPHFGIEALNRDGEVEETFSYPVQTGIVSEETSATMRYILEMVVAEGSGRNGQVQGFRVGGKTATSQTLPRGSGRYISSFIGFAPADDPQVIAIAIINNPQGIYYGGQVAAPIIRQLYENILPYLGLEKTEEPEETAESGE